MATFANVVGQILTVPYPPVMNKNVAVRNIEFAMELVGIGDANDAN